MHVFIVPDLSLFQSGDLFANPDRPSAGGMGGGGATFGGIGEQISAAAKQTQVYPLSERR